MIKSEYTANQYMQTTPSYRAIKQNKSTIKDSAFGVLILGAVCFLFVFAFFAN
jgi:hypothetical protein